MTFTLKCDGCDQLIASGDDHASVSLVKVEDNKSVGQVTGHFHIECVPAQLDVLALGPVQATE